MNLNKEKRALKEREKEKKRKQESRKKEKEKASYQTVLEVLQHHLLVPPESTLISTNLFPQRYWRPPERNGVGESRGRKRKGDME